MKNIFFILLIVILSLNPNVSYALNYSNLEPIKLEYNFSNLDDFIKSDDLKYSYCKYRSYLDNLNNILKDYSEFEGANLEDLLKNIDSMPDEIALKVKVNASNALNYEYFFKNLSETKTTPNYALLKEINESFSSFDNFKSEFKNTALNSNCTWIFLAKNPQNKLYLTTSKEVSCPLIYKHVIVLCLNIDENIHLDKNTFIDNFFNFINWEQVYKNYSYKIYN